MSDYTGRSTMKLERRVDGWWIVGVPDTVPECGPYERTVDGKAEAKSDLEGLKRFFRDEADKQPQTPIAR